MNIHNAKIVIKKAVEAFLTPVLWARHGVGKSDITKQVAMESAKERGLEFTDKTDMFDDKHFGFVDLRLGQMEVGDLLGMPDIDKEEGKTVWHKPNWFPTEKGSKGIIFLDELNRARLDVLQAVFQLVWDRRISTHILPEGWWIVVACNPAGSEYFVNDIDPALMDRFVHIKLQPEVKEWVEYAKNKGNFMPSAVEFIEKYHSALGLDGFNFSLDVKPSPRSWEILSKMLKDLDEELWSEVAIGVIGSEQAIAFIQHCKSNLERPVYGNQILNSYPKWRKKVQSYVEGKDGNMRTDVLQISCNDVERILKKEFVTEGKIFGKDHEKNLTDFIRDLPKDLSFGLIKTIVDPKIMKSDKFNEVLCRHNDIYLLLEEVTTLGV